LQSATRPRQGALSSPQVEICALGRRGSGQKDFSPDVEVFSYFIISIDRAGDAKAVARGIWTDRPDGT
jgi:hypothetical protein